ncbi:MAG TPA: carboxypeptidase-like regulatory domain-containing protein, partial [Bacteroidia bacterium]|nr:carboxypeptidase-like regulatory domain-containing protein [Bacteroidia bacterium]
MRQFLLIAFIVLSTQAFSQKMSISGNVQDTTLKVPMKNVVAMVVRIKDSVLIAHTRTNDKGFFTFTNLEIDTVQVIVSDSKFSEQSYYVFGSAASHEFDFGKIILPPKSQQLGEVIIYAYKDPVYYKGDTLIYTADSFKVKPNATVEDLLRKLPGIKVDAQGKITSQGKDISQVLVDGDEFFGSDPTVATKNLAAKGVESVQVYEKKNENAGDGEEETTQVMNLKLKEDAKKGYFGKVSGASDFQNFYEGELLANKFKKSLKVSVFALASNTPRSSFGWGDMYKFGLENDNFQSNEDGDMFWYYKGNENKGVPQTLKSGFYYTDKIGKKTKLGLNYTYTNNQLDAVGATRSQYFLSDSTGYITDNSSRNIQKTEGHAINFKITQTLDSLTELEFEPKIKLNSTKQDNFSITNFLTDEDTLTRQTNVRNTNKAEGYDIN